MASQTHEYSVEEPILTVGGDVERPLSLSRSDLATLPRQELRATDHGGREALYEGVALCEVLRLAGVKFVEETPGDLLRTCVTAEAEDGHAVAFALAEFDPAYTDRVILLADQRDGESILPSNGPYCLIVPDEKKQGRWVRQVRSLTVHHL